MDFKYEKFGVEIERTQFTMVFKKNGLTIEMPLWMLDDFNIAYDIMLLEAQRKAIERSEI